MMKMINKLTLSVCCILALGLFSMPYGYYTLLRLCVCVYAGYIFYLRYTKERFSFANILFLFIALLYNPIIKVSFERDVWLFINIITIIFFLFPCVKISHVVNSLKKVKNSCFVKRETLTQAWKTLLKTTIVFLVLSFLLNVGIRCSDYIGKSIETDIAGNKIDATMGKPSDKESDSTSTSMWLPDVASITRGNRHIPDYVYEYKRDAITIFISGVIDGVEAIGDLKYRFFMICGEMKKYFAEAGNNKEKAHDQVYSNWSKLESIRYERYKHSSKAELEDWVYALGQYFVLFVISFLFTGFLQLFMGIKKRILDMVTHP